MSVLTTRGVDGLHDGFLELPGQVYAEDPHWIPEEPEVVAAAFSAANPWFATNRCKVFCHPGSARLVLFHNPGLLVGGEATAFFGYWETQQEPGVDRQLFDLGRQWAREQGATVLFGPINFTTFGNYRLRLSVEDDLLPFPGEPYNPPGYTALLESLGFRPYERYLTQVADHKVIEVAIDIGRPLLKKLRAEGYRLELMDHAAWLENLDRFHELVDAIFGENFGYTPIPRAAFRTVLGQSFIRKACPKTSVIAHAPDGSVAGFFLTYPHYGSITVQGAKDRVPVSQLDFTAHESRVTRRPESAIITKTVGVHPAHRNQGIFEALASLLIEHGMELYQDWFGALIREGNYSARFGDRFNLPKRHYALYRTRL